MEGVRTIADERTVQFNQHGKPMILSNERGSTARGQHADMLLRFRIPPNCKFEIDDLELEWTYRKVSIGHNGIYQ